MRNILHSNLDLFSIKVFVTIYEKKSASLTAAEMCVPISKVSRGLKRVREALGDDLFTRKRHGMIPNDFADMVYPAAKKMLNCCATLQMIADDPTEESTKPFNIAAPEIISFPMTKPLLSMVHAEEKGLIFTISIWDKDSIRDIASGNTDIGIFCADNLAHEDFINEDISVVKLHELSSLYLSCDEKHPILAKGISLSSIASYPRVGCNIGGFSSSYCGKYQDYCDKNSIGLDSDIDISSVSTLFDLLRGSNYLSITPIPSIHQGIANINGLHSCQLSEVETRGIYKDVGIQNIYLAYNNKNKKIDFPWIKSKVEYLLKKSLSYN